MLCWRQWLMVSMFELCNHMFQTAISHEYLLTCRKRFELVHLLVPWVHTMIQQQSFIMMRVVAMSLKLEIKLFINMYKPSEYKHNSRTRTPCTNLPTLEVWEWCSHMAPKMHLSSHRVAVVTQGSMGIIPLLWQPVHLEHSEGRKFCPLWAHLLSI